MKSITAGNNRRSARKAYLPVATGLLLFVALSLAGVGYQHGLAFNVAQQDDVKPARVSVDVLPGQAAKVIDRAGNPMTAVAIYGSRDLDVSRVDLSSVTVAGASLITRGDGRFKSRLRDLNHDEFPDLVVYAWTKELKLENTAGVQVDGRTVDGASFTGGQAVRYTDSSQERPRDLVGDAKQAIVTSNSLAQIVPETVNLYTNNTKIFIPAIGTANAGANTGAPGSPYPSTITVAGFPTVIGKIAVILNGFEHCTPDDVDILLVGPTGAQALIIGDDGGGSAIGTNAVYAGTAAPANPATGPNTANCGSANAQVQAAPTTFSVTSDATRPIVPDSGGIPIGSYQPSKGATNADADPFPAPAPAGAHPATYAAFIGTNPNGTWSLYTADDQGGDVGAIDSGWVLDIAGPTAAPATVSGQVLTPDGQPVAGTVVQLGGGKSDRTITDSTGRYKFENVNTDNFYTVRPERANYSFSPAERSFSLNADKTDAVFTATPDSIATSNPLETDMFFVRQQYLDFLGREPDSEGLKYWTNELDKCASDADCLTQRRIGVSAAFFKESEPQQTGSYIYRLYQGALGRQLSYQEFSTDRQQVVGGADLEASRAAFADAFVRRAEFQQKYSQAQSAESFVDDLLQTIRQGSGADLSGQRSALIARYNSGGEINQSRSLVLREAVESGGFKEAEYNPSFVLMEYFGYLRRDPEEGGYRFWLNVLNTKEPNNYVGMVCSFITSAEYQARFSSYAAHSNRECAR